MIFIYLYCLGFYSPCMGFLEANLGLFSKTVTGNIVYL